MILEKLGNKVNPKKYIRRSTWKGEIDRIALQNCEHGVGRSREGGRGRQDKRRRGGEDNLREQDGGRSEMRARKEIS